MNALHDHCGSHRAWLSAIALWLLVGVCCLLPLGWMVGQVVMAPEVLPQVRWSAFQASLLGRTLLYNGAAAVLAVGMAIPGILVVGRGRGWVATVLLVCLPLAFLMPSITYTYGWTQVFRLLGIHPEPGSAGDVLRCIWTLACWLWALPALAVGLSLRYSDSQIQQQAILDGALWRVTTRQLIPAGLAALAVVLVLAMQEFAVYERTGISVIATEIRTVFETGALNASTTDIASVVAGAGQDSPRQAERAAAAVATALPMLGIVVALSLAAFGLIRRVSAGESMEYQAWPRVLDAGWWAKAVTVLVLLVTLAVPTGAMVVSMARPLDPMHTWAVLGPHVSGSLFIGLLSGGVALGLALLACVRRTPVLLWGAVVTFLVGGELLGIANIRIYNRPAGLAAWIYNNAPIMVIAYLGRFGWLALLAGQTSWSSSMRELRAMADLDGAGAWRTARWVVWPIALPVLVASAVLVVILGMTEVPATVLLSPQRPQMLVPLLMGWIHMLRYDDMLEGSLLLMGMVLLLGLAFMGLMVAGVRLLGLANRLAGSRSGRM